MSGGYPPPTMHCPYCTADDTRVIDSRPAEEGRVVRRRRACEQCGQRFTTFERAAIAVIVRKRDGTLQPFDVAKVRRGVERALTDRPVPPEDVDAFLAGLQRSILAGAPETTSEEIGRRVLEGLRALDEVAYLRFASVYKEFQGAADFEREVAALESEGSAQKGI